MTPGLYIGNQKQDQKRQRQKNAKKKKNAGHSQSRNKSFWFHDQCQKLAQPPEARLLVANVSRVAQPSPMTLESHHYLLVGNQWEVSKVVAQAYTQDQQDINCSSQHRVMTKKTPKYQSVSLVLSSNMISFSLILLVFCLLFPRPN